jgi:hypothetical protein
MLVYPEPTDRPLTPGEALAKLFLDNADRGANAANDELIEALKQRIRALADPPTSNEPAPTGKHHPVDGRPAEAR